MQGKSEKYFEQFLSNITNKQLIEFYKDLELTPFPVLVLKEYQNRFKSKDKKETLEKPKTNSRLKNDKKQNFFSKENRSRDSKTIFKNKKINELVSKSKVSSSEKNLWILEKLGKLNKRGIITKDEFNQKKKELLKRI